MTRLGPCAAGLALALVGAACGPTYSMTDDIDLTWDFAPTPRRFDDNLHSPYVRGAAVTVFAHSSDDGEDLRGWSVESSDPAVFRIDGPVASGGRDLAVQEKGHADGDWLAALAQAYDAGGARIFGVDYAWKVDGTAQVADGDLYRYQFKAGQYAMVQAQRGAHVNAAQIQSEGGFVDSTNHVGCAAGGGGGSLVVGLIGLGLVAVRRRPVTRRG